MAAHSSYAALLSTVVARPGCLAPPASKAVHTCRHHGGARGPSRPPSIVTALPPYSRNPCLYQARHGAGAMGV
ncbi:hypothetical protein GQ53DRAFT_756072, partial [Thozetella sp. PMI_491]